MRLVWRLRVGFWGLGLQLSRSSDWKFRFGVLGFRAQGLGFRVSGLGFRFWASALRVFLDSGCVFLWCCGLSHMAS